MSSVAQPVQSSPPKPKWRVTQMHVISSEFLKLRTVRSTYWTYLITLAVTVGLGALFSLATALAYAGGDLPPGTVMDPTGTSLSGLFLSQLAVGVLGVLFISSEYSSGMIRATFSAVPKRLPVLVAKAVVLAVSTFVVTLVGSFAAFFVGQLVFKTQHLETSLSADGVLRAVVGCALYLTGVALLGLALGAILRSTAGAIAVLAGLLFVLPILVAFLPQTFSQNITKYQPGTAGQAIIQVFQQPTLLSPWAGFALFCGYIAVLLIIATFLVKKRDA